MDRSVYNLRNKARRFYGVLRQNMLSMLGCWVIIAGLSYLGVSLASVTSHDASDLSILGTAMVCESGPYFDKAVDRHIALLKEFKGYMDERYMAGFQGILSDKYNPKKDLEEVLKSLEEAKATGGREVLANAIWQAGEELFQFEIKAASFPRMKIALYEHPKVTSLLVNNIKEACGGSDKALSQFINEPEVLTAFELCEKNRLTMLRLFLARRLLTEPNEKYIKEFLVRFRDVVKETRKRERIYIDSLSNDSQKSEKMIVQHFRKSEKSRLDILNAIANNDIEEAYVLRCEAFEKAFNLREEMLEISKDFEKQEDTVSYNNPI